MKYVYTFYITNSLNQKRFRYIQEIFMCKLFFNKNLRSNKIKSKITLNFD